MAVNMDALLKIRADVQGTNNIVALNRGLHSVEGTAKGVTAAMRGMTGAAAGLSGALGALAPLLTVAGLVGMAKASLESGVKMNDLAIRTGIAVESLAKFRKAASTTGTDIDAVSKALVKLSKGMLDAHSGNKQAAAAFKALGVSITDSKGKLKSSDEVMFQVANRFRDMNDPVAKTALAVRLFGRAGAEMIPMLNMGGDAIEKMGVKMTTAFAQKADEYNDKLIKLKGSVGALGQDLFIVLLPALTAVTDAVSGAVKAFNGLPAPIKAVATAGALLAIAWGPIGGLIKGAQTAFIAGAAAIGTFRVQMALASMEGIPAFSAAIMSIPLAGWAIAAVAAIGALSVALYQNNKAFKDWADTSVNFIKVMASDGMGTMQKFGQWLGQAWNGLVNYAKGVGAKVGQAFSGPFGMIANVARSVFDFVAQKIQGLWNMLPEGVRKSIGGVGSYFQGAWNKAAGMTAAGDGKAEGNQRAAGFMPDLAALDTGGNAKKESDKAAKLAERRREQLADADKLLATENGRLEVSAAATELEKIQAEYEKTQVERRVKFLALQKGALSDQARAVYAEAQFRAIQADRLDYNAKIQKLMQEQTRELYNQVGLARVLDKELQRSIGSAFSGSTGTGTFRTDVDLMPGLTGGELGTRMEELKKSLADLQDPIKQVMAGAQAMGQAFSDSFKGLIDGSMTAQQAMAGFFKSIANHFLDMASQMVAKYIEMQIIGLAQQFLPGFGSVFGAGGAPNYSGAFGSPLGFGNQYGYGGGASILGSANGNVFAANGIVPYAMGGIVDRPMLFPFAKGGAMATGLMGEAGPEAIMPLKRGADGKLGVAGGGGGTTNISIAVDASGTKAEGDQGKSGALARDLAAVVDQRLIYHKRPGGILA